MKALLPGISKIQEKSLTITHAIPKFISAVLSAVKVITDPLHKCTRRLL
jgi:hypothetical protein